MSNKLISGAVYQMLLRCLSLPLLLQHHIKILKLFQWFFLSCYSLHLWKDKLWLLSLIMCSTKIIYSLLVALYAFLLIWCWCFVDLSFDISQQPWIGKPKLYCTFVICRRIHLVSLVPEVPFTAKMRLTFEVYMSVYIWCLSWNKVQESWPPVEQLFMILQCFNLSVHPTHTQ